VGDDNGELDLASGSLVGPEDVVIDLVVLGVFDPERDAEEGVWGWSVDDDGAVEGSGWGGEGESDASLECADGCAAEAFVGIELETRLVVFEGGLCDDDANGLDPVGVGFELVETVDAYEGLLVFVGE
jgi:hypothetical protein